MCSRIFVGGENPTGISQEIKNYACSSKLSKQYLKELFKEKNVKAVRGLCDCMYRSSNQHKTQDHRDPDEISLMNSIHRTSNVLSFSQMRLKVFFLRKKILKLLNAMHHVNIRSLSKNFDNLLDILRDSNYSVNVLCITETWCTDSALKNNSNLRRVSIGGKGAFSKFKEKCPEIGEKCPN